jgi:prepilin-type N-terminal cleavage/methylation domain-containing protein
MEKNRKRTAPMKKQAGMTLVEVVVALIITSIVAGVGIVILLMHNDQLQYSALNTKLQAHYETALLQIAKVARTANSVQPWSETWPPAAAAVTVASTQSIRMFDTGGVTIGGFQTSSNALLQEYDTAQKKFKTFKVGADSVHITAAPKSDFAISNTRRQLTVNISVYTAYAAKRDTVPSKQETFLCRN